MSEASMLKRIIVILVVLACAAGGIWWLYDGKRQPSDLLTLYGNVDIRQVDVGFAWRARDRTLQGRG